MYIIKNITDFHDNNINISFYDSLVVAFENMKKYHRFMKEACLMEGQNYLKNYV